MSTLSETKSVLKKANAVLARVIKQQLVGKVGAVITSVQQTWRTVRPQIVTTIGTASAEVTAWKKTLADIRSGRRWFEAHVTQDETNGRKAFHIKARLMPQEKEKS